MFNAFLHHIQTNEVLAHSLFVDLGYNARVLLNNAADGHDLRKICEDLLELLDRLSEGTQDMRGNS